LPNTLTKHSTDCSAIFSYLLKKHTPKLVDVKVTLERVSTARQKEGT
jgi:hypothetical protein